MFTTCSITGCSIESYMKEAWLYMLTMVAVLLILTYVPGIVMLVPNLLS